MGDELSPIIVETAKSLQQPTIAQLIDTLVKQKGLKEKQATKAVYTEYKKGTLTLTDTNPPTNIANFFFNLESAWFWAITALVVATLLAVFTINTSVLIYARYVLGGVFILFLPGFMLMSALYPRKEMDELEKAALSIGLSLSHSAAHRISTKLHPLGNKTRTHHDLTSSLHRNPCRHSSSAPIQILPTRPKIIIPYPPTSQLKTNLPFA